MILGGAPKSKCVVMLCRNSSWLTKENLHLCLTLWTLFCSCNATFFFFFPHFICFLSLNVFFFFLNTHFCCELHFGRVRVFVRNQDKFYSLVNLLLFHLNKRFLMFNSIIYLFIFKISRFPPYPSNQIFTV